MSRCGHLGDGQRIERPNHHQACQSSRGVREEDETCHNPFWLVGSSKYKGDLETWKLPSWIEISVSHASDCRSESRIDGEETKSRLCFGYRSKSSSGCEKSSLLMKSTMSLWYWCSFRRDVDDYDWDKGTTKEQVTNNPSIECLVLQSLFVRFICGSVFLSLGILGLGFWINCILKFLELKLEFKSATEIPAMY